MNECVKCNRSYFKTPHVCTQFYLVNPPSSKRPPVKSHTILFEAFELLKKEGVIVEVESSVFALAQ